MFQSIYNHGMTIREVSQQTLDRVQGGYERSRNTFESVPLYNTLSDCIKALDGYYSPVTMPDSTTVHPRDINYPQLASPFIFVTFPIEERWPGEY